MSKNRMRVSRGSRMYRIIIGRGGTFIRDYPPTIHHQSIAKLRVYQPLRHRERFVLFIRRVFRFEWMKT